ncbi:hypothetical protein, partial [uncultured Pseudomonas sp.]|uniref:hypothetical protein n=1 Tax=uncultured Pseudomonas sp. TaxID=114707 RepID=UPI00258EFBCD
CQMCDFMVVLSTVKRLTAPVYRAPSRRPLNFSHEKREATWASLQQLSSVLGACGAGSPHTVFWKVRSPGAWPILLDGLAASARLGRIAVD